MFASRLGRERKVEDSNNGHWTEYISNSESFDKKKKKEDLNNFKNKMSHGGQGAHRGLAHDLRTLLMLMQLAGHFMPDYAVAKQQQQQSGRGLLRYVYSLVNISLETLHFLCLLAQLLIQFGDTAALVSNMLTMLFFLHGVTKVTYFALKRKQFYRTMLVWESSHSHPLFVESDVKHRALGEREMLRLMRYVLVATGVTALLWAAHPFLSTDAMPSSPDNNTLLSTNVTVLGVDLLSSTAVTPAVMQLQGPKLMVNAWYPWDPYSSSFLYVITYLFQLYWLVFCICQVNLMDTLFCSWLIYGCEQLRHLKEGMQGLMQLSASEAALAAAGDVFPDTREASEMADNASNLFLRSTSRVFPAMTGTARVRHTVTPEMLGFRNLEPPLAGQNAEQQQELLRQDMVVRSAIKYWVERHKHILRFVESIGETYGMALLLHMLTSTVTLTLLSYEATKIAGVNLYAFTVIGYLCYTLGQVFLFCVFGNRLIEESVSVMHAAYSCPWYDGSEEAKTFVQIVCQQCQRPMSVSGAKFFTVSLDLFASVLGAVVTYFMVLIQLN